MSMSYHVTDDEYLLFYVYTHVCIYIHVLVHNMHVLGIRIYSGPRANIIMGMRIHVPPPVHTHVN